MFLRWFRDMTDRGPGTGRYPQNLHGDWLPADPEEDMQVFNEELWAEARPRQYRLPDNHVRSSCD